MIGKTLGHFRILEKIGQRGMGARPEEGERIRQLILNRWSEAPGKRFRLIPIIMTRG